MKLILFLLLVWVSVTACAVLFLVARARNRRMLLTAARAARSDTPDGIGISVLCSGVSDPEQIENLLSSEYARYEVVVVLDAQRHAAEFAALVARYRMIRVEWVSSGELEVAGVRALGRSRKRNFRRLVLVDRAYDGREGDLDAAAAVATYDFLLPVGAGQRLLPGAVERLVAELGGEPAGTIELVRSYLGERTLLLGREALIAAGGFGMRPLWGIPASRRRTLWEPLLVQPSACIRLPRRMRAALAVLLIAALVVTAAVGWWIVAAILVTVALVWTVAGCVWRFADEMAPSVGGGFALWRPMVGSLLGCAGFSGRNFTMS